MLITVQIHSKNRFIHLINIYGAGTACQQCVSTQAMTRTEAYVIPFPRSSLSNGWQGWTNWKLWHNVINAMVGNLQEMLHLDVWERGEAKASWKKWCPSDLEGWLDKGEERRKCSRRMSNLCRARGNKEEFFS